ncbi:MAG: transcriptional regulator NrdR [Janthinobacterium lividum]
MDCPFCHHPDTQVVDSRVVENGAVIRRRRRCQQCDKRFTTYERSVLALPVVVKKDGRRVEFERRKIEASMRLALRKRPVNTDAVDDAIERIELRLFGAGEREIQSEKLGELVMNELRRLDQIAYIRFASVYRRFEDVADFRDAIDELGPADVPSPPSRLPEQ